MINESSLPHDGLQALHPLAPTGGRRAGGVGWDEPRQVVLTTFDNVPPRKEFVMEFAPLRGEKSIPATLPFAVQVTYSGERALFTLDLQFSSGEYEDR
jgi:hypothetical protein